MGDEPVQMSDFKFGRLSAWNTPWTPDQGSSMMLPDKVLQPGESYLIAAVYDFIEKIHLIDPDNFGKNLTKKEWWTLADMQLHIKDAQSEFYPEVYDSISPGANIMATWGGRDCWYLEQHLSDVDSVVVDQVGGVFDESNGTNMNGGYYDVAGVTGATGNSVLIRKFNVKNGNIDFATARGVGLDDSEWIPIPLPEDQYDLDRWVLWTAGNHGDYNLDENTLVSDLAEVDLANKTIIVPWGTRNNDYVMSLFEKKPGIGWKYHLSEAREDSAYNSVRTGDKLTIYVTGNDLDMETFDLIVAQPTADANIVVPKYRTDADGYYSSGINNQRSEVFSVTQNMPEMDTIKSNTFYGIPYATHTDTLLMYLEKAPKASWEIVWVDGTERTSVIDGDKLKVTAENGDVKEYYIKVYKYRPSHNAKLSSITWPDIPEFYKGLFGWLGDTIPNFGPGALNYVVQVPLDVDGIPALVAKTEQLNATVDVKRAVNLAGSTEQKTVSFKVTAEDGETTNVYTVQLEKEKNPVNVQPYMAEPFLSEVVFRDNYANNFWEIANPGNVPLDISNYMFYWGGSSDPAAAISGSSGVDDWANRYNKYVPGYKWSDQANWSVDPGKLEQDLNVNAWILPGDVFVMADITNISLSGYPWWASDQSDIIFQTDYNPWSEVCGKPAIWYNNNFFMFKILNDSVKNGLKAANDPQDFELLESWSMGDGSRWNIAGNDVNQVHHFIRKPQYYLANDIAKASWGTNTEDSEWLIYNEAYYRAQGAGWPARRLNVTIDIGKHFMNEVTIYKSTVASSVYKVSPGFGMNESIRGLTTGTTVADFYNNIVKADEGQNLKVLSAADGTELGMEAAINLNDVLEVLSADSINTTKYILEVTESGLSSNAVLTSARYNIQIITEPKSAGDENAGTATISGFEYGTKLQTIVENVIVPSGASMDVIDVNGAYVPLTMLNFDTTYVAVLVTDAVYFDVTAENGITKIIYQLIPEANPSDAFLTSTVYNVVQKDALIKYVPRGTNVINFMGNLVPSAGATVKLVDKLGHERTTGQIVADDKVVVTSPDGNNTKVYHISLLRTQYILEPTYLAYILSDVYAIDQVNYIVDGVDGTAEVGDVLSKVNANAGATAMVVDANGNDKLSGTISRDDMILVTSADGKVKVYYTLGTLTANRIYESDDISLYPNPTDGKINISGLKTGYRIQVFNAVGAAVHDLMVQSSIEAVNLDNQPAGLYMIVISDNQKMIGRYKALKQ
jgi:hypothetical protein